MLSTLDELRQFAVARNFFKRTTLKRALHRMGFVQADPIRAPARAQDLILRHRVTNYHAGELESRYESLDIHEDVFVNYGFVTRSLQALMHPREDGGSGEEGKRGRGRTETLLEFVRERGVVHPREVDEHFSHGTVTNYWGGSSNATTRLLDEMHYRGLLRVARRDKGIRIYTAYEHQPAPETEAERHRRIDALVDTVVRIYAPLPSASLSNYVRRLRYAAPQWQGELSAALQRAKERLTQASVNGVAWYWPATGEVSGHRPQVSSLKSRVGRPGGEAGETVRLLAPFDPLVHDRARFELLWGWAYRFEAYTPASKRKLGYYAMPLLWRADVIGWGNLSVKNGELEAEFGYAGSPPRDRTFKRELAAELGRIRTFLNLDARPKGASQLPRAR